MIAACFIVFIFCLLLLLLVYGWSKATTHTPPREYKSQREALVSLIIPVRNDAHFRAPEIVVVKFGHALLEITN